MTMPTQKRQEEGGDEEPFVLVTLPIENHEKEDDDGFVLTAKPSVEGKEEQIQEEAGAVVTSSDDHLNEAEVFQQKSALWLFGALIAVLVLQGIVLGLHDMVVDRQTTSTVPEAEWSGWDTKHIEDAMKELGYESMYPGEQNDLEDLHYESIDVVISDYLDNLKYEDLAKAAINPSFEAPPPSHSPTCKADVDDENPAEPPRIKPVVAARIIEGIPIPSQGAPLRQECDQTKIFTKPVVVRSETGAPLPITGSQWTFASEDEPLKDIKIFTKPVVVRSETGAPLPITGSQWTFASEDEPLKDIVKFVGSAIVPVPSRSSSWEGMDKRHTIQDSFIPFSVETVPMPPANVPARSLIPFASPQEEYKRSRIEPVPSMGYLYYAPTFNRTIQSDTINSAGVSFVPSGRLVPKVRRAITLTDVTFDLHLKYNNDVFVAFLKPSTSYGKNLTSVWNEFAELVRDRKLPVSVTTVDCSEYKDLCKKQRVHYVPLTRWFHRGKGIDYTMERTAESLIQYTDKSLTDFAKTNEGKTNRKLGQEKVVGKTDNHSQSYYPSLSNVSGTIKDHNSTYGGLHKCVQLTEATFHDFVSQNHNVFVKFYRPCISNETLCASLWNKFTDAVKSEDLPVKVASVDCKAHPTVCNKQGIDHLPVFRWFGYGKAVKPDYETYRTVKKLMKYTKKKLGGFGDINVKKTVSRVVEEPSVVGSHRVSETTKDRSNSTSDGIHTCITLTESTFDDFVQQRHAVFVTFYHPCPAYEKFNVSIWNNFTDAVESKGLPLTVATVDCKAQPALCKKYRIGPFPVHRWFRYGKAVKPDFRKEQTVEQLLKYSKRRLRAASGKEALLHVKNTDAPSATKIQPPPVAFFKKNHKVSSTDDDMHAPMIVSLKVNRSSPSAVASMVKDNVAKNETLSSKKAESTTNHAVATSSHVIKKVKAAPRAIAKVKTNESTE